MKVHKFYNLDELNEFLDECIDDSNLYVRIVFNKKNEEVYFVIEKNSPKRQRFEKQPYLTNQRFGPPKQY